MSESGGMGSPIGTERAFGKLSIHEVVHLVLKRLPAGVLVWVLITLFSVLGGVFSLGYNIAVYTQKPSEVESRLLSQKDALQGELDKMRGLAEERRHAVESLSSSFTALSGRSDQFVQDTAKLIAALKEEHSATTQARDQTIAGLNQLLAARSQEAQQAAGSLRDREQALQQRDQTIIGLNQQLSTRGQEVQQAAAQLKEREQALQQRDQTISTLNQQLASRGQDAQQAAAQLKERDQTIAGLNQTLAVRNQEMQKLTASLRERDQTVEALQAKLDAAGPK